MSQHLARYMRTHLAGSNAGVELFERGARKLPEPAASVISRIHGELLDEQAALQRMMDAHDVSENPVINVAAKIGESVSRLKPSGDVLGRDAMTDFVDLETMRVALAGKLAGWEALIAIADSEPTLNRAELERWAQQARDQAEAVRELHIAAAPAALKDG